MIRICWSAHASFLKSQTPPIISMLEVSYLGTHTLHYQTHGGGIELPAYKFQGIHHINMWKAFFFILHLGGGGGYEG